MFTITVESKDFNAFRAYTHSEPVRVLATHVFTGHRSDLEPQIAGALEERFARGPFGNVQEEVSRILRGFEDSLRDRGLGYVLVTALQATWGEKAIEVQQLGSEFALLQGPSVAAPPLNLEAFRAFSPTLAEPTWWHVLPTGAAAIDCRLAREEGEFARSTVTLAELPCRIVSSLVWKAQMKQPAAFTAAVDFARSAREVYGVDYPHPFLVVEKVAPNDA